MIQPPKHKYRYVGDTEYYDCWGYKQVKKEFIPTKQYMEYLKQKQLEKELFELKVMKEKLEYQYKTYGEVDKLDFDNYIRKAQSLQ